jgi:hypothetical protein
MTRSSVYGPRLTCQQPYAIPDTNELAISTPHNAVRQNSRCLFVTRVEQGVPQQGGYAVGEEEVGVLFFGTRFAPQVIYFGGVRDADADEVGLELGNVGRRAKLELAEGSKEAVPESGLRRVMVLPGSQRQQQGAGRQGAPLRPAI